MKHVSPGPGPADAAMDSGGPTAASRDRPGPVLGTFHATVRVAGVWAAVRYAGVGALLGLAVLAAGLLLLHTRPDPGRRRSGR